jgi:hypothetical protein
MIGVTISVGSFVAAAALNQFGLASGSASTGASVQQNAAGIRLGLSYVAVLSSPSCPHYGGSNEGTALTLALYDFGTESYVPTEFIVNSTFYSGAYPSVGPESFQTFSLTLAGCAHGSGLTITALDAVGDGAQFES